MGKPFMHAKTSVKRFGGKPSDYIKIHEKMDCSKGEIGDIRHRLLTHHMFFVRECIVPIFGSTLVNSDGNEVSVVEVCELHIYEDFSDEGKHDGFIPTAGDYLAHLDFATWMNNGEGGAPESQKKRVEWQKSREAHDRAVEIIRGFQDDGVMDTTLESPKEPPRTKNLPPVSPASHSFYPVAIDGGGRFPPKPNPYEPIDEKPKDTKPLPTPKRKMTPAFYDGPIRFD